MGLDTLTSGINTSFSTELNNNFKATKQGIAPYTGTGFNTSGSADTANYELTAVTAANIVNADYAFIDIMATTTVSADSGEGHEVTLKIETKETGDSYSTLIEEVFVKESSSGNEASQVFRGVLTITAGMITNGFQVKITATNSSFGGGSLSFANKFTTITLSA